MVRSVGVIYFLGALAMVGGCIFVGCFNNNHVVVGDIRYALEFVVGYGRSVDVIYFLGVLDMVGGCIDDICLLDVLIIIMLLVILSMLLDL